MAKTKVLDYSELDDEWTVDREAGVYLSRQSEDQDFQRLIFNEPFRDGQLGATITPKAGRKLDEGGEAKVAAIVFRYQDPKNYYYAGIGGFSGRFFIAKMAALQGQPLQSAGRASSLRKNVDYNLVVRCTGNRITLSHNGVAQLSVFDDTFNSGPWGLHTWRTTAEFRNLSASSVKPTCFVIMPFAAEFDEVYQVIRETVVNRNFDCIRADERYLSGPIIEDVVEQIQKSDLVVADFTGKNANVYYEAGYADALRKPVIRIAQSVGDLPFDVRHLRTFSYNTRLLGDRKLAHDLGEAIRATTGLEPATAL